MSWSVSWVCVCVASEDAGATIAFILQCPDSQLLLLSFFFFFFALQWEKVKRGKCRIWQVGLIKAMRQIKWIGGGMKRADDWDKMMHKKTKKLHLTRQSDPDQLLHWFQWLTSPPHPLHGPHYGHCASHLPCFHRPETLMQHRVIDQSLISLGWFSIHPTVRCTNAGLLLTKA